MRFTIDRIDHIVINCRNVEISAAWYQRVLGMEREEFGASRRTALKFGGQKINLRPIDADVLVLADRRLRRPGAADVCFIAAVPPDEVIGHLHDNGVRSCKARSRGPVRSGRSCRCIAAIQTAT